MSSNITSKDYENLAGDAITLIDDINAVARRMQQIEDSMRECGLKLTPIENEDELQRLARIAATATEHKHDALRKEAIEEINATVRGERSPRPRSFIGRKIYALSRVIG